MNPTIVALLLALPLSSSIAADAGTPPVEESRAAPAVSDTSYAVSDADTSRRVVSPVEFSESPTFLSPAAARVSEAGGAAAGARGDLAGNVAAALRGRVVSSGWAGQRASVSAGVLPPSMTSMRLAGRSADDWVSTGIDIFSAFAAGTTVVAQSGHDLSSWPMLLSPVSTATSSLHAEGGPGPIVALEPPAVGDRPFALLTMSGGSLDWKETAFEFGRHLLDGGVAVSGAYESREGRGPEVGGRHEAGHVRGSVAVALRDGWAARFSGLRRDVERDLPIADGPWRVTRSVNSDTDAALTNGSSSYGLHHSSLWLSSSQTSGERGTLAVELTGFTASMDVSLGPIGRVELFGDRRAASGGLLTATEEAYGYGANVGWHVRPAPLWRVEGSLGAFRLAGETLPSVGATASRESGERDLILGGRFGGRHPSVLERCSAPVELSPGSLRLEGNPGLDAERAVLGFIEYRDRTRLQELGARAEVCRVLSPIVLEASAEGDTFTPTNAGGETGASLRLWARAGEDGGASLELTAAGRLFDEDGPLNALCPVPAYDAGLSASAPVRLFDGYLEITTGAVVAHRGGLARGAWTGLIDDSATTLALFAYASAGDAHLRAGVEDLLDSGAERLPGLPTAGRMFYAAFSWDFWD